MRLLAIAVALLVWTGPASAQTQPAERPPATSPPSGLALPSVWTKAGLEKRQGDLMAWFDKTWRDTVQSRTNDRPNMITGYFAIVNGEPGAGRAPGIVWGAMGVDYFDITTPADSWARYGLAAEYVTPVPICKGAPRESFYFLNPKDAVYLGPEFRPEFERLEAELIGSAGRGLGISAPEANKVGWSRAPEINLDRSFPKAAKAAGVKTGTAQLSCYILDSFAMACGVVSETPAGYGFGEAARLAIQQSRARVAKTDGDGNPTAGMCRNLTVEFKLPN